MKIARYYTKGCPGLEFVTQREIIERIQQANIIESKPGIVIFDYDGEPRDTLALRSVDSVYAYVEQYQDVPTDESGLNYLEMLAERVSLENAVGILKNVKKMNVDAPSFRVTAERTGEHAYKSPQAAAALGSGVVHHYGWRVDLTGFDIEVCAHITREHLLLGINLTEQPLSRRNRFIHGRTSLNSGIAYALWQLAQPRAGDIFIDPMCGTASILIEAALEHPDVTFLGGDIDAQPLQGSIANIQFAKAPVTLMQWDARRLPLNSMSADCLVSNLPFGRRVGSHRSNRQLYPRFLHEVARVLKKSGKAILLTLERRLMAEVLASEQSLLLTETYIVDINGLLASVYVIVKCDAPACLPVRCTQTGAESRQVKREM